MRHSGFRDWFGLEGFAPGADFLNKGAPLYLLDHVDSTSDFLLARGGGATGRLCRWGGWGWQANPAERHEPLVFPPGGTVAVSRHQTHGRGRLGRVWNDWGGLALSWVVRPSEAALRGGLPVWIGLILALALQELSSCKVWLKWPNDLLVEGVKLGGLLLDRIGPPSPAFVVVGLGLNLDGELADLPPSLHGRATSLRMLTGRRLSPSEVAGTLLCRLEEEWPRFETGKWQPFRQELDDCDWLRGRSVTLTVGQTQVQGTAVGIDEQGALMLKTRRGEPMRWKVGDVNLARVSQE